MNESALKLNLDSHRTSNHFNSCQHESTVDIQMHYFSLCGILLKYVDAVTNISEYEVKTPKNC